MDSERYYIFCDESGNDNEHPVVGCVVVEKKKYDELLSIIKPKYLEYEKQNPKFEEIHFVSFKGTYAKFKKIDRLYEFTKHILSCVKNDVRFYSLILNEKIDASSQKYKYYNILLNKVCEDFNIKQSQIEKVIIDKYQKQDQEKIGNFECYFVDSKHKKSNSNCSYFIQICDCLVGSVRYVKNYTKNIEMVIGFCDFIKKEFNINDIISINNNYIVKDYKKNRKNKQ